MTRKLLRILLTLSIAGVLIFAGVITYQIRHQTLKTATVGSSDFPALNLLSEEIGTDTESLIKANLQIYVGAKFNPKTAYILAKDYKKTSQPDGTKQFQFYMTVPEVTSTYQVNFTTSFLSDPVITLVCAPESVQPAGSQGCYKNQGEETMSMTLNRRGFKYA